MNLLIASNNAHKIEEIKNILQGKFDNVYSLAEANIFCDPEENGSTFLQNAVIKATEIAKLTNMPVLADDTGLCVNALGGQPGITSARYAGNHDSKANRQKLQKELAPYNDRTAYFVTCMVLLYPDGKMLTAEGRVDGYILKEEQGDGGFGYDCIFYCNDLNKSFGLATAEEKNAVSHRGRALQNLLKQL